MRSTWTDSRLDDLKKGVDARLDDLNGRVTELNGRVGALGDEVHGLRSEIGALQRTLLQVGAGLAGTMMVGFFGLIATQL